MFGIVSTLLAASLSMASIPSATSDDQTPPLSDYYTFTPEIRIDRQDGGDKYENNNTLDSAVCMTPSNYGGGFGYISTVSGALQCGNTGGDTDLFFLKNMTDCRFTIDVNTLDKPIFVAIEQYDYLTARTNGSSSQTYTGELHHTVSRLYETKDGITDTHQTFQFDASAGTYFIRVEFLASDYNRVDTNYGIRVQMDYAFDHYVDTNVEDAIFNKGLAGAVWLSDLPIKNCEDFYEMPSQITYHQDTSTPLSYPEYFLDDLYAYTKKEPYCYATYYLWDEDLIAAIRKVTLDMIQFLNGLEEDIEIRNQMVSAVFDKGAKIVRLIAKFVEKGGELLNFSSIYDEGLVIGLEGIATVLDVLLKLLWTPTDNVKTFKSMLTNLAIALNKSVNQMGYRVIEIPLYFTIWEDYNALYPRKECTVIDTSVTANVLSQKTDWYCDDHILPCARKIGDQLYQTGRFYGFKAKAMPETGFDVAPIEEFAATPHKDKPLKVDIPSSIYAYQGDYALCSFTAEQAGTYCVELPYESSSERLELATFASAPIGYTDEGMLQSNVGGMMNNSHSSIGAHLDVELAEGQKVYFRVKNGEYARFQPVSIEVRSTPIEHHDTITYQWKTDRQHWKRCGCGYQRLEGHFVSSSNPNVCVFCYGRASMGFIGGGNRAPGVNQEFGHGSYLRADGIYVISDEDMPSLLAGTLDYPNKA